MKSFTAAYFHRVDQCLPQPLHSYSTHDAIIQQILDNPMQMHIYIMYTDDYTSDLQQIMHENNLKAFKNSIIAVNLSYNSNQSEQQEFIIEEETHTKDQNFRHFSCQLSQRMELLPVHKIINHINQLLSNITMHSSQTECANQLMESNTLRNEHGEIETKDKALPKTNFSNKNSQLNDDLQLKFANKSSEQSFVKQFCSGALINKDTAMDIINFAISNIQSRKKFKSSSNFQSNSCFSSIPVNRNFSNHQKISSMPLAEAVNASWKQNITKFFKSESHNRSLWNDKKIHHLNIFEQNYQTLFTYQAQKVDVFDNDDYQPVVIFGHSSSYQNTEGNTNLINQQECEKNNLSETCDLIIILGEMNKDNLQMDIVEWEQIILLPRTQFDKMLHSLLLSKVKEDLACPFNDVKKPPTPNGIICIKLSLLQCEVKNENSIKIISLMNLLQNYFSYFTYVYSEDSHQVQQEIIKSLQNELQIGGQISIKPDEKVSKTYDSTFNRYVCTFPNDQENWSDYFEINRNHIFCIYDDKSKIIVSVYEEQLEYQHLFEALHKIYEDQLVLKIFDIQDKLSENTQKLLCGTDDFVAYTNNQKTFPNSKMDGLFLLAENNERIFISQTSSGVEKEEVEMTQHKKLFAMKIYSFFGVNTPSCCLSYQSLCSNSVTAESNEKISSQLCLMTECLKGCQFLSQSFITDYKNNKHQYYYHPSTLNEGPLVGFGSALLAAYLLGDTDFFGDKFQNVCFIKKNGYYELTKMATSNLSPYHNENKTTLNMEGQINVVLVGSGEDTITVEDLCEYDRFELMIQISKLNESERFAERVWDQFINTKYSEQFKHLEREWGCKVQMITKKLLKGNQSSVKSMEKQNSLSGNHSTSKNSFKNLSATEFLNHLNERNTFFTREVKYVAEETDLGAGCFGVVSIAHSIKDPTKKFALKRLFDNKRILRDGGEINAGKDSAECNYKEEHDRELEALMKVKRIKSPFLVGYIGAQLLKNDIKGTHRLELIMELCNGDLTSYLKNLRRKKEKLSLSKCYEIFSQIVEGMRMLHKNQIMHRDIKPQNILYKKIQIEGEDMIVWKIGDFGLASMKKSLNNAAGTPEYMAPEILGDEGYDKAVDIWSLGLVLHKILFGHSYYSKNNFGTEYKLSIEELEKIDKETNDLLVKMMEKDTKKRITIEDVHNILKNQNKDKVIRKIMNFDEDNEREEQKEENLPEKDSKETEKSNEIKEILENSHEWMALGCYNKAYNMLMDVYLIIKKSRNADIQGYLCITLIEIGFSAHLLGKLKEALEFLKESLSVSIKIYGEEHFVSAVSYFKIGSTLKLLGQYEEALTYTNRALSIFLKEYGEQHVQTAQIYNEIGVLMWYLGKYKEALIYYNRVLSIRAKRYGDQHVETPETNQTYQNIGNTLQALCKDKEAFAYYNRVLPITIKRYGEQHTQTALVYACIGSLLSNLGNNEEALTYYNRALSIQIKQYGEEHVQTASTYQNIGIAITRSGKYEEALTYYNRALSINVKQYGEQHMITARSYGGIGFIYERLQKYNEAFKLYNQFLSALTRTFGQMHPHTKIVFMLTTFYKLKTDNCQIF